MSLTFFQNLNRFLSFVAVLLLLGLTIFVSNLEIKDVDLWLHIATGRFILENFSIPQLDVLSFTINDIAWINHEWLFQVLIHFVYTLFGPEGLINLRVIAISLTMLILLVIGYNGKKIDPAVFLLVPVLLTYMMRLMLRPDMFSLLFFILFIYTLAVQIDRRSSLIMLFVIQLLWVNMHGFFIFGPLLVLLMVVAETCKRYVKLPYEWGKVGRYSDEEYKRLILAFFVVLLACLVNPYHIKGLLYPLGVLTSLSGESQVFFEHIMELGKPIEWNTLFAYNQYRPYRIMILLSALSFIFNRKRLDIGMFGLWVFFLIFSLNALRNMTFFAVVSYLVILINLQHIEWRRYFSQDLIEKEKLMQIGLLAVKGCLIFWMINLVFSLSTRGYFDFDTLKRKSEYGGITQRNYPYKAVDFLVKNKIKGNIFNDFNSGAYLLGRTHPDIRVYIDGRTEVYGPHYFKEHLKMWLGNQELLNENINKYKITGAFLNSIKKPAPARLIRNLYHDPKWKLVYFDYDASVFLLDIPENKKWIDQFQINLDDYQVQPFDLMLVGTKLISPYQYTHRAAALYNVGLYGKAEEEVREALSIRPNDYLSLKLLGKIHIMNRAYERAFKELRASVLLNGGDNETRYYLALSLFHMDQLKESTKQCQRVLLKNPYNNKGLALLAFIYAREGSLEKARQIFPKEDGRLYTIKEIVEEINPGKELLSNLNLPL